MDNILISKDDYIGLVELVTLSIINRQKSIIMHLA